MALIYIDDNDPWISEHEACDSLFREIMEQLTLRDREPRNSRAYTSHSANIRLRLKQFSTQILQLSNRVKEAHKQHLITEEEAERRNRQIEQLQSKDRYIQRLYEHRSNDLTEARNRLLGRGSSAFADGGTTSWGIDDDNNQPIDVNVTVDDLKTRQKQILQQQDEGLEELSKIISRQKQIAQTINSEVDNQNEVIDDLADHMDRTDQRIVVGNREVMTISHKDNVCCYWFIILTLFIVIIIVILI